MSAAADHGTPLATGPGRSRMRAFAQILGGVVLGLGLAAAVGLDPGLLFAGYTIGLGVLLLALGLLLPEQPDDTGDRPGGPAPTPTEPV
jgi:hypothetical protein